MGTITSLRPSQLPPHRPPRQPSPNLKAGGNQSSHLPLLLPSAFEPRQIVVLPSLRQIHQQLLETHRFLLLPKALQLDPITSRHTNTIVQS